MFSETAVTREEIALLTAMIFAILVSLCFKMSTVHVVLDFYTIITFIPYKALKYIVEKFKK